MWYHKLLVFPQKLVFIYLFVIYNKYYIIYIYLYITHIYIYTSYVIYTYRMLVSLFV